MFFSWPGPSRYISGASSRSMTALNSALATACRNAARNRAVTAGGRPRGAPTPLRAPGRQQAQRAGLDMRRPGARIGQRVDMAGEHALQRFGAALVGHMVQL